MNIYKPKFDRVMIVDDNVIDLYITKRLIIKNNFGKTVFEYTNAQEAIKHLKDYQETAFMLPQVIFIDIYMPLMSGFEFLAAYDNLPAAFKKNCKVYIISSSIDQTDIAICENNKNLAAFQVKPITKQFLEHIDAD